MVESNPTQIKSEKINVKQEIHNEIIRHRYNSVEGIKYRIITPQKGVKEVSNKGLNSSAVIYMIFLSLDWFEQSTLRLSSCSR